MRIGRIVKVTFLCLLVILIYQYYSKNIVIYDEVDFDGLSEKIAEIFPRDWSTQWGYEKVVNYGGKLDLQYGVWMRKESVRALIINNTSGIKYRSKINPYIDICVSQYKHNQSLLELPLRDLAIRRPIFKFLTCGCIDKLGYSYPRCLLDYPIGNYRATLNMYFHNNKCDGGRVNPWLVDEVRDIGARFDKLVYDYLQSYRLTPTS